MITVTWIYKSKITGKWMENTNSFNTKEKALRFMYKIGKKYGYMSIVSWSCDDPFDNEYLNQRYRY